MANIAVYQESGAEANATAYKAQAIAEYQQVLTEYKSKAAALEASMAVSQSKEEQLSSLDLSYHKIFPKKFPNGEEDSLVYNRLRSPLHGFRIPDGAPNKKDAIRRLFYLPATEGIQKRASFCVLRKMGATVRCLPPKRRQWRMQRGGRKEASRLTRPTGA